MRKYSCYLIFLPIILLLSCKVQESADEEKWIALFNGKDLSGWDVKIAGHDLNDNYKETFLVEDEMLRVSYEEYETFDDKYGHLYYHQPFSHYIIRFEYRFTGEQLKGGAEWNVRNSGVMLHTQSAKSMKKDQDFPASLELQLLGGLGSEERPTANLCTPGTYVEMNGEVTYEHCINSESETFHGDQWVKASAVVLGDSVIHHLVEGDTVLTYHKPKLGGDNWVENAGEPLKEGYIALQAESHAIDFRNIELLNLKGCTRPGCENYKTYYIESGDCDRCQQ